MITLERLKQIMFYDPQTGVFTNLIARGPRGKGSPAGHLGKDGYIVIRIGRKNYFAHRLAWMYMFGEQPSQMLDHIDGDRANNRILNLRCVTSSENQKNSSIKSVNTSGCIGVYWNKEKKAWMAHIKSDGKMKNLGYFQDIEDAIAARKAAEPALGFHPNHGRPLAYRSRPSRPDDTSEWRT